MDKWRNESVDIIEWLDDNRSTLAWRFPRYNNEIQEWRRADRPRGSGSGASSIAVNWLIASGPGHCQLMSENVPIMSTLLGCKQGFNSPFRSEVYFINTRPITDLRWGTANPVTACDPDFKRFRCGRTASARLVRG